MEIVLCFECEQASNKQQWAGQHGCPNPACWPGYKAATQVRIAWERLREQAWDERDKRIAWVSKVAWDAVWERHHPRPVDPPQPTFGMWTLG